jgi:hypothetical protein
MRYPDDIDSIRNEIKTIIDDLPLPPVNGVNVRGIAGDCTLLLEWNWRLESYQPLWHDVA